MRSITLHLASSRHMARVRAQLGLPVAPVERIKAEAPTSASAFSYAVHTAAYPSSVNLYASPLPPPSPLPSPPRPPPAPPPLARQGPHQAPKTPKKTQADRVSGLLDKLFALDGATALHTAQLGYSNIAAVLSDVSWVNTVDPPDSLFPTRHHRPSSTIGGSCLLCSVSYE